ncbi:MAG: PD-(D/E)XK nuclease family protein [Blastocatellia bacterium]
MCPAGLDHLILSGAVSHALGLPFSTEDDDIEIWDYKSGSMPKKNSYEMKSYQYQMQVYAELYRQQTGEYPARSVLVFVGELGDDKEWAKAEKDLNPARYPMLVYAGPSSSQTRARSSHRFSQHRRGN